MGAQAWPPITTERLWGLVPSSSVWGHLVQGPGPWSRERGVLACTGPATNTDLVRHRPTTAHRRPSGAGPRAQTEAGHAAGLCEDKDTCPHKRGSHGMSLGDRGPWSLREADLRTVEAAGRGDGPALQRTRRPREEPGTGAPTQTRKRPNCSLIPSSPQNRDGTGQSPPGKGQRHTWERTAHV